MLSREIQGKLGARYLTREVYSYSFEEQLNALNVKHDEEALLGSNSRAAILRHWYDYLLWGGLPEATHMKVKRDYISSVFQKIYLGDICTRNKIASPSILRLMLKKIADSVRQPISYSRLSQVLSSVSGKVSVPTVAKYLEISTFPRMNLPYRFRTA